MKYKCIREYWIEDVKVMSPGDIIIVKGDDLYNVTTSLDFTNVHNTDGLFLYIQPFEEETKSSGPVTQFNTIIKEMYETFKKKNNDYGNSFEQSLDEEGLAAARIRIGDKWNRFKTLSKGKEQQVNDESLRDTLMDMANYAIMTVMWLSK